MKNKFLAIIICLCLIISLSACNKNIAENLDDSITTSGGNGSVSIAEDKDKALMESETQNSRGGSSSNKSGSNTAGSIISTGNSVGFIPDGNNSAESYTQITENQFIKTAENNLSTFAADVDTASYARLRRFILENQNYIPSDAIRVEEMINYFSYDYKKPEGDSPFSVETEIFACPWNDGSKLLKIGIGTDSPDYQSMPKSNLVFLIDVSGSMSSADKLPLVQQAFSMLSENLRADDRISIVTYAASDTIVLDGAYGNEQMKIQNAIEDLQAGGGTYGSKGIITAYELASKHFIKDGNNRVILATDGDLNIGVTDTDELKKLIIEKKNSGVFLSVMGFGTGNLKDDKLEALADNGNGNYNYIDNKFEARKVLTEEMGGTLFTIAKDVKFQVEFNKDAISEYRLIGYENRLMASEDFEDDTKDGGEIGAGHRVTILYELKTADESKEDWLTLNIRYKAPDKDKSELKVHKVGKAQLTKAPNENSVFAASVAQFGMLLKNSDYTSGSYSDIYNSISKLNCIKDDVYKKEFVELVKKFVK